MNKSFQHSLIWAHTCKPIKQKEREKQNRAYASAFLLTAQKSKIDWQVKFRDIKLHYNNNNDFTSKWLQPIFEHYIGIACDQPI